MSVGAGSRISSITLHRCREMMVSVGAGPRISSITLHRCREMMVGGVLGLGSPQSLCIGVGR